MRARHQPEAIAADDGDRTYSLHDNGHINARLPWLLRCYGRGAGVVENGVPSSYADRDAAERAARSWVALGTKG